jgi:hypothetical protein
VTVYRDGRRVRSAAVVTAGRVPEAGLARKAWYLVRGPLLVLAALGGVAFLVVRRRRTPAAGQRPARAG